MANMSQDSDLLEYEPDIKNFGIQSFSDLHTKTTNDILRKLRIEWWPRATYGRYDITTGTYTEIQPIHKSGCVSCVVRIHIS